MRFAAVLLLVLCFAFPGSVFGRGSAAAHDLSMWVWRTDDVVSTPESIDRFLADARAIGLCDVYLYLQPRDLVTRETALLQLVSGLKAQGARTWGLDGWRGYFSDGDGPEQLYATLDAMIAFNARHPTAAFAGFHSDLEPQDGQGAGQPLFHNGLSDSRLDPEQRADRDALMADWVAIHSALRERTRAAGIKYGAAMPSWLDDYFGEPVTMLVKGERSQVIGEIMPLVDEFVVMSYATQTSRTIERMRGELAYAQSLPAPPRILFGVETHPGPGPAVSYADAPPRNNRRAVLADIDGISAELSGFGSLSGAAIHDWQGWKQLAP